MFTYHILAVLSVLLFFQGFFPISKFENGPQQRAPEHVKGLNLNTSSLYKSKFTKTVVIVIDALRLDFINGLNTPILFEQVENEGCLINVTVESPTVTMPRIKALTSGNVPQFIDLVLNLASSEVLEDSIIHSAYENGLKLLFYGDDTWLKIFPKYFSRFEGTTSFFVKDFYEVDKNVTRNIEKEVYSKDWDIMIAHYLGLDHIGHVYGPRSNLIQPKLKEMEEIIMKTYKTLQKQNEKVLMIITGDHGMKDSGGHGGSTFSEVNVPLVVLGLDCKPGKIKQVDIPVNLAVLLGLNIPRTSIGQISDNFLSSLNYERYLLGLLYNSDVLSKKSSVCNEMIDLAKDFHKMYLEKKEVTFAVKAKELYENCSLLISETLVKNSVKQNLPVLYLSIILMVYFLVTNIKNYCDITNISCPYIPLFVIIIAHLIVVLPEILTYISSLIIFVYTCINMVNVNMIFKGKFDTIAIMLLILIILHPLTFFSSSFIEEEQQVWYCFVPLIMLILFINNLDFTMKNIVKYVISAIVFRFIITINQVGDKWSHLPDFADWLKKDYNFFYLNSFFVLGLFSVCFCVFLFSKSKASKINSLIVLILIYKLKNSDNNNIDLAQLIWFLIFINLCIDKTVISWVLICSLLLKPYNIFMISFCVLSSYLYKNQKNDYHLIIFNIWLGNSLYFAQGHSNSIASVDISVGYIGLRSYEPLFVFLQVFCHIFAFPVLSHLLIMDSRKDIFNKTYNFILLNRLYINLVISIVTLLHKDHLFIWSVFAPKLFIETVTITFLLLEFSLFKYILLLIDLYHKSKNKFTKK